MILRVCLSFLYLSLFGKNIFAQEFPVKRSISLTRGVYHDEKVEEAPKKLSVSGYFRKHLTYEYFPRTKTIRFFPKNVKSPVDVTFFVKNPKTKKIIYDFRIHIKTTPLFRIAIEVQNLLQNIDGIQVRTLNNKVLIDGNVISPSDFRRVYSVISEYNQSDPTAPLVNLVNLHPAAAKEVAAVMERAVNNKNVTVEAINARFVIKGVVPSQEESDRIEKLVKTYRPDLVVTPDRSQLVKEREGKFRVENLLQVKATPPRPKKLVQIVARYVALNKDYAKHFKFVWRPGINTDESITLGGGVAGGLPQITSQILGTIDSFIPKLNWAKAHGYARDLYTGMVLTKEGQKGTIVSKNVETIPSQVRDKTVNTGFDLSVTPTVNDKERTITLNVQMSVSDGSTSGSSVLNKNNSINTVIDVRNTHSAVIGGLMITRMLKDFNKVPSERSDPILSFVNSRNRSKTQQEVVVFITPIVKSSASSGVERYKRRFRVGNK